jgi:DNA-binding NarL/FixJ family response regulator
MEKIRIIIVEDDKEMREGLELIIKTNPLLECIATCSSGEEAQEVIPDHLPDIVLMDIHLPGISGIECVKRLKPALSFTQFMMWINEAIIDLFHGGSPMSSIIARKVIQAFKPAVEQNPEIEKLTVREREMLDLLAKGYRYKEIADQLFISFETVRTHIHNIYEKLHVQSRTEALNKVFPR